jgi:hypothetical protein
MMADLRSRAQYLSLALFSQRVVRVLLDYLEKGQTDALHATLDDALQSLENVNRGELPGLSRRKAAVFSSYEHLRTLEQVWDDKDRELAVRTISLVLGQTPESQEAQASARTLIDLFERLGNEARWNFEQPDLASPRTLLELCQVG